MNLIWNLIKKDLLRKAKAPVGVLILIAIPLFISLIFGLVFSPGAKQALPRFKVLLVDRDKSFVSNFVKSAFTQGELARMVELQEIDPAGGANLMARGKATALLEIPAGFGADLLDGRAVTLRLVKNPAEQFTPEIAQKITETVTLLLDYGARLLAEPLQRIQTSNEGKPDAFPDAASWMAISESLRSSLSRVSKYVYPPVIALKTEEDRKEEKPGPQINFFALFLPGFTLLSLFYLASAGFRDLAAERTGGQLRRIFVTPARPWQVLAGKFTYTFILVAGAFTIMTAAGILIFRIRIHSPLLFLAAGGLASLACTGLMALVYCLMGEERRSEAVSSIVIVLSCMLGGSFFPLSAMPPFFQFPARLTVNFWSIDLLQRAIQPELSQFSPGISALVLAGIALATLTAAGFLLHRSLGKGVGQ